MLPLLLAGAAGALGSVLAGKAGKATEPYFRNAEDAISSGYRPYADWGHQLFPQLQQQFGNLTQDPGGQLNQIGQGYQSSPGFNFALQQALQSGTDAARRGGMLGSPMHQQNAMQTATGLANQDYNSWIQNALGLYGQGLQGLGGLNQMGYGASTGMADSLANLNLSHAGVKYDTAQNRGNALMGGFGGAMQAFSGGK